MKNRIFIVLLLISSVILLSQCNEDQLLDKKPADVPNAGGFFTNASSARQSVVAIFPYWKGYYLFGGGYMTTWIDMVSDDAYIDGDRKNSPWRVNWTDWNIKPDFNTGTDFFWTWWQSIYQSINAANFAIEYIPTSSDKNFTPEDQKMYIGVARMMRGFAYIYLTGLWGDVPLHTKFLSNAEGVYLAKSPKIDVLQFAIEDLKYATENLPVEWKATEDKGLPTKAAAAGLLARAYLYAQDYPNAETAAKDAIDIANNCGFYMMDDYEYMMSYKSQTDSKNKEFIFAFEFVPSLENQGNRATVYRGIKDAPDFLKVIFIGSGFGYAVPTRNLVDAFEPGDPRRKYSMYIPGDYWGIYQGATTTYTNPITKVTTTYHQGDTVKYQAGWSFGNANTKKFINSVKGLTNTELDGYDVPILRYAELYLYYAEALIENNKIAEGMAQINKVRGRPSVNMSPLTATDQADAREKLRHERRVELSMEGIRIFDLFRWGIMKDVFGEGPDSRKILAQVGNDTLYRRTNCAFPRNNLFPIPQRELNINPLMTQNPGY